MDQPYERLLTGEEVGKWVGLTPSALSQMRFKGTGPKFRKLGPKTVRYSAADVQAWIEASARTQTGAPQEGEARIPNDRTTGVTHRDSKGPRAAGPSGAMSVGTPVGLQLGGPRRGSDRS